MATSGTYGTTVINVQEFIDKGARRAGKLAEELTSEQVSTARSSLHILLSTLINIGIQYFAIDKKVFGLKENQYIYTLPAGSNDVLQALYRRMNRPTGDYATSDGGNVANALIATLIRSAPRHRLTAISRSITARTTLSTLDQSAFCLRQVVALR
jgi:hypothetical protein